MQGPLCVYVQSMRGGLQCNTVSHWLGTYREWSLLMSTNSSQKKHYLLACIAPWDKRQNTHLEVPRKIPHIEDTSRIEDLGEVPFHSAIRFDIYTVISVFQCDEVFEARRKYCGMTISRSTQYYNSPQTQHLLIFHVSGCTYAWCTHGAAFTNID